MKKQDNDTLLAGPSLKAHYRWVQDSATQVLSFDGATSVSIPSVANFPVQSMSLGMHLNTTQEAVNAVILTYDPESDDSGQIKLSNPHSLTVSLGPNALDAGVGVADGQWHDLVVSLFQVGAGRYAVRIFIDAIPVYENLKGVSLPSSPLIEAGKPLTLGKGNQALSEVGFEGKMSEFRVWNGAIPVETCANYLQTRVSEGTDNIELVWGLSDSDTSGTLTGGTFVDARIGWKKASLNVKLEGVDSATPFQINYQSMTGCRKNTVTEYVSGANAQITGLDVGQRYRVRARTGTLGSYSDWSSWVDLVTLPLNQPVVGPVNIDVEANTVAVVWPVVDQAKSYSVFLFKNAETTPDHSYPIEQGTSVTLPDLPLSPDTWRIAVEAYSVGAISPASLINEIQPTSVEIEYRADGDDNNVLQVDWESVQQANEYLIVIDKMVDQTWTRVFSATARKEDTSRLVTSSQVPTADQDQFRARVRVLSNGYLGAWAESNALTVSALPAVVLSYSWAAQTNKLSLAWGAVVEGAKYTVKIFKEGTVEPIRVVEGLEQLTFDITEYLTDSNAYTFKVHATLNGSSGPANEVATPPELVDNFFFDESSSSLELEWQAVPAIYLELFNQDAVSVDQAFIEGPVSTYSFPVGLPVTEGTHYRLKIRVLSTGVMTANSEEQLVVHILGAPNTSYEHALPETVSILWEDVRTEAQKTDGLLVSYQVYEDISGQPSLIGTSAETRFDVSTYLSLKEHLAASKFFVVATAEGSNSRRSVTTTPTDVDVDFYFDQTSQTLNAKWTAGQLMFFAVQKLDQSGDITNYFSDANTGELNSLLPGPFSEGEQYILNYRSLPITGISEAQSKTVKVEVISSPILSVIAESNQPVMIWPDVRSAAQVDADLPITYSALIIKQGESEPVERLSGLENSAAGRRVNLQGVSSQEGEFTVVVTPFALGTYGLVNTPSRANAPIIALATMGAQGVNLDVQLGQNDNPLVWVQATNQNDSSTQHQLAAQASFDFTVSANNGDQFALKARGLNSGFMSNFGEPRTITYHSGMVAPVISGVEANQTISLSWTFDDTIFSGSAVSYKVVLSGAANAIKYETTKQASFEGLTLAAGQQYTIAVTAIVDGSLSPAGSTSLVIDAPSKVLGVKASSNNQSDIIVAWSKLTDTSASYKIQIKGGNDFLKVLEGPYASSPITMSQSQTGVTGGNTYQVSVAGMKSGLVGPWSDPDSVMVGETQSVPPGNENNPPTHGDPINLSSGSQSLDEADLMFWGQYPIQFVRFYNTFTPINSESGFYDGKPMGNRWSHSFNTRIYKDLERKEVYLVWGSGAVETFLIPSTITGIYTSKTVYNGTSLVFTSDLKFVLTLKDRSKLIFDDNGLFIEQHSQIGNKLLLSYTESVLSKITDAQNGNFIILHYNVDGRIERIEDSASREISYKYDANGDLSEYTDPKNLSRNYLYWDTGELENKSLLKTAIDQAQNVFLYNEYEVLQVGEGQQYRVVFQQDGNNYKASEGLPVEQRIGLSIEYSQGELDGEAIVVASATDANGNHSISTSIKATGNVISTKTILSESRFHEISFTYDAFNNIRTITDFEGIQEEKNNHIGNITTFEYDEFLNVSSVNLGHTVGTIFQQTFNDAGFLHTTTDKLGNTTTYDYYPDNTLKTVTNALGQVETFEYKEGQIKGLVSNYVDTLNNVTTFEYNADQRSKETNPLNEVKHYGYNAYGFLQATAFYSAESVDIANLVQERDEMGFLTLTSSRFADQAEADAFVTRYTPSPINKVAFKVNALNATTTYEYWPGLQRHTVQLPSDGNRTLLTTYNYDNNNNLNEIIKTNSIRSSFTYDSLNRRITQVNANLKTTTTEYRMVFSAGANDFPREVKRVLPLLEGEESPHTTLTQVDLLNRVIASVNASQHKTDYSYSVEGEQAPFTERVSETFPPDNPDEPNERYSVVRNYDALGRPVKLINQSGNITSWSYETIAGGANDSNMLLVTERSPLGIKNKWFFNAVGHLVQMQSGEIEVGDIQQSLRTASYQYDALGRLTHVSEPGEGQSVVETIYDYRYVQDKKALQMKFTVNGKELERVLYDGVGHVVEIVDALQASEVRTYYPSGPINTLARANGKTLTFSYDNANRFTQLEQSDGPTIVQTLDAMGNRLVSTVDGVQSVGRQFDNWGRLTHRTDAQDKTVLTHYWPTNLVRQIDYAGEGNVPSVGYTYTGRGLLNKVTDWQQRVTTYQYHPTEQIHTVSYPSGAVSTYAVDGDQRLTDLSTVTNGRVVSQIAYILNSLGQPTSLTERSPAYVSRLPRAETTYTFNDADQLTKIGDNALAYDASGNLTMTEDQVEITHNALNLVTSIGTRSFQYDADYMRTGVQDGEQKTSFIRTANRFSSAYLNLGSPSRKVKGGMFYQSPFSDSTLEASAGSSKSQNQINRSGDWMLTMIDDANQGARTDFVHGLGLIAEQKGETYREYVFDDRGNTVAMLDEKGELQAGFTYSAYGAEIKGFGVRPMFMFDGRDGLETDASGFVFARNRCYSPQQRRFIERDYFLGDLHRSQTLNPYAYVTNNPYQFVDPLGLHHSSGWGWLGTLAGGIVGVGALTITAAGLIGSAAAASANAGAVGAGASGVAGFTLGLDSTIGSIEGGIEGGIDGGLEGGAEGGLEGGAEGLEPEEGYQPGEGTQSTDSLLNRPPPARPSLFSRVGRFFRGIANRIRFSSEIARNAAAKEAGTYELYEDAVSMTELGGD